MRDDCLHRNTGSLQLWEFIILHPLAIKRHSCYESKKGRNTVMSWVMYQHVSTFLIQTMLKSWSNHAIVKLTTLDA